MKKQTDKQTVITQADFARRLKEAPQRITKLIEAGVIDRRPDGRLNLEESLARAQTYLKAQADAQALHSGKNALITRKLLLQCERLTIENDKARGQVHDKTACANSLSEAISIANGHLMGLGSRLAAQLPEVPRLKEIADATVDAILDQLRAAVKVNP
jgi:hypothetical protein